MEKQKWTIVVARKVLMKGDPDFANSKDSTIQEFIENGFVDELVRPKTPEDIFVGVMDAYADGMYEEGTNPGPEADDFWLTYKDMINRFVPFYVRWKLNGDKDVQDGTEYAPIDWDRIRENKSVREYILNSNQGG